MGTKILIGIIIFAAAALITILERRCSFIKSIGAVTVCYALGGIISITGIPYDKAFCETVASVAVVLAIPLILFSTDMRKTVKVAKKTMLSFVLIGVIVVVVASVAAVIGKNAGVAYTAELSGMASGLYIGGTPNLFAVGSSLLKDTMDPVRLAYLADSLIGGIYFFLLISVIKRVYKSFLGGVSLKSEGLDLEPEAQKEKRLGKTRVINTLKSLGLALACFGVGAGAELLINGNLDGSMYIMIIVSVLGIAFSFVKPIRENEDGLHLGEFFILVFSLGIGMSMNIQAYADDLLTYMLYFGGIQVVSLLVHFIVCKILKIDGGTAIITSTAAIYGPPFVITVADAYDDKSLAGGGVVCGALGLAVGNIIGILVGRLLLLII